MTHHKRKKSRKLHAKKHVSKKGIPLTTTAHNSFANQLSSVYNLMTNPNTAFNQTAWNTNPNVGSLASLPASMLAPPVLVNNLLKQSSGSGLFSTLSSLLGV